MAVKPLYLVIHSRDAASSTNHRPKSAPLGVPKQDSASSHSNPERKRDTALVAGLASRLLHLTGR